MSVAEGGRNREQQGSKDTQSAPSGQGADSAGTPRTLKIPVKKQQVTDGKIFFRRVLPCPSGQPRKGLQTGGSAAGAIFSARRLH